MALISKADAARKLGVSARTLDRLEQNCTGPLRIRIGRRVLFDSKQLSEWVDQQQAHRPEPDAGKVV